MKPRSAEELAAWVKAIEWAEENGYPQGAERLRRIAANPQPIAHTERGTTTTRIPWDDINYLARGRVRRW